MQSFTGKRIPEVGEARPLIYYRQKLDNYEQMANSGNVLSAAEKETLLALTLELYHLPEEVTLGLRDRAIGIRYQFVANGARAKYGRF